MTVSVDIQFVDISNGGPISGLPVTIRYSWPPNYAGQGAGSRTVSEVSDGNGNVTLTLTELNSFETNGSFSINEKTPGVGGIVTEYSTTSVFGGKETIYTTSPYMYPTNKTWSIGHPQAYEAGNVTLTSKVSVKPQTVTTTTTGKPPTTTGIPTTTVHSTTGLTNTWNNFWAGIEQDVSNAGQTLQGDLEIVAVLGALVVVAIIVGVLYMRKEGGGGE